MSKRLSYSFILDNGKRKIEYAWADRPAGLPSHAGLATCVFLRPEGLPPSDAETEWVQIMTGTYGYTVHRRKSPNGRYLDAAPGDVPTSLDPLETSVKANLLF